MNAYFISARRAGCRREQNFTIARTCRFPLPFATRVAIRSAVRTLNGPVSQSPHAQHARQHREREHEYPIVPLHGLDVFRYVGERRVDVLPYHKAKSPKISGRRGIGSSIGGISIRSEGVPLSEPYVTNGPGGVWRAKNTCVGEPTFRHETRKPSRSRVKIPKNIAFPRWRAMGRS